MSAIALRRVKAFVDAWGNDYVNDFVAGETNKRVELSAADLRALLKLAEAADELRRRIDKAVAMLERTGEDGCILEVDDVLAVLSPRRALFDAVKDVKSSVLVSAGPLPRAKRKR